VPEDPYDTLRVRPDADDDELRRAYRQRARERHPDKLATVGGPADRDAGSRMRRVIAAYQQLSDPSTRADVDDRRLRRRARSALVAVVCASGALVLVAAFAIGVLGAREPALSHAPSDATLAAAVRATDSRPLDARAWDLRWRAEMAAGRNGDASASLLRAVQLDPTNVDLHEQRARLAVARGDTRTAVTEMTWLRANGFEGLANQLSGP